MKKAALSAISLIAFAFSLVSCNSDNDPTIEPVEEQSYTHTLLLYFPWPGSSLHSYILQNIKSIRSAIVTDGGTGSTRVMMFLTSSSSEADLCELSCQDSYCVIDTLRHYSNSDFTETSQIQEIFNEVAAYSPTDTYSMLVGAHGYGWLPKGVKPVSSRAFGGTTADLLTDIAQLDSAITYSGIGHLNFLCFDDCYMANVETAYELRNSTDHLIASTSEIMDVGMPYETVWSYLREKNCDLQSVIGGFYDYYIAYTYPYGALSAIDCSLLEQAAEAMKGLNARMDEAGISPSDFSPQILDGYSTSVFFDMKDYTDQVTEALGLTAADMSGLENLYGNTIHCCTPKLYFTVSGSAFTRDIATNCGITISDPTTNSSVLNSIETTSWWAATH